VPAPNQTIELPRARRQPALKHLQKVVFPDDYVSKVLDLRTGDDISEKLFDRRVFSSFSSPLFIEITSSSRRDVDDGQSVYEEIQSDSHLFGEMDLDALESEPYIAERFGVRVPNLAGLVRRSGERDHFRRHVLFSIPWNI
jgi:hypothetical protein